MPYKPSHVANAFLYRAKEERIPIDHLKLQKLMYFLQGWFLAVRQEPVVGEQFEAWPYGPVLSSIYHEFKTNGSKPITEYAIDIDPISGDRKTLMANLKDREFFEVFDKVWDRYKKYSGLDLSSLTHAEGTPWDIARKNSNIYLSNKEIEKHFRSIAEKQR